MSSRSPKKLASRGLRRSHETMATRWPAPAMTTPRLATVAVLPSVSLALVTTTVRSECWWATNCSEVRSDR